MGQAQLRAMLQRPELVQFAQRISLDFHLGPLPMDVAVQYIHHRVALAGAREHLFSRGAAQMIGHVGSGIPRVINAVCDAALVYGYALHSKKITTKIVQEVLGDRDNFGLVPLHPSGPPRLVNQQEPPPKRDRDSA